MVSEDILLKDTGAQLSAEGRKMLTALYAAMRSLRLYPLENQVVQRALGEVDACAQMVLKRDKRMQLRLAGDFVFFNDARVRLDLANYASYVFVRKALEVQGLGDIQASARVDIREWTSFLSILVSEPDEAEKPLEAFRVRMKQAGVENIKVGPAASLVDALSLSEEAKEAARRTYARSVSVVKEVMTTEVVTATPDMSLRDAARLMLERKIGCLVVVEDGKLAGILTESDFVALTATAKRGSA